MLEFRWKLLDFALLKRNSVSFFDIEKPETAISRWSRARMRAAKVEFIGIIPYPPPYVSLTCGPITLDPPRR